MAAIPAMTELEVGGTAQSAIQPTVTIAAWNVERCLFPQKSANLLARYAPQVVLLSEMDSGMARTAQANTSAEMAKGLGMAYAYGVEFHEMDLGGATERHFCKDTFNAAGWHGNAILSAIPFQRLRLIRLDDHGHWFVPGTNDQDPGQPRIGGRMAVAAVIGQGAAALCVVSTHLESNGDVAYRGAQFDLLMDAIDDFAPGLPVVIGGDLNTGNRLPPDFDWRRETLFEAARLRGYHWDATAPGTTTRASFMTPHPTRQSKLDWLCTRGMTATQAQIVPALDPTGQPLSDHDPVLAQFTQA